MQRGFCRGRQLSLNIVDIDTYMRAFNDLSGMCEADYSPEDDSDAHLFSDDVAEDGKVTLRCDTTQSKVTLRCDTGASSTAAAEGLSFKGDIGKIPAAMLYDFCNAFPTLLHEWMWLVLNVL